MATEESAILLADHSSQPIIGLCETHFKFREKCQHFTMRGGQGFFPRRYSGYILMMVKVYGDMVTRAGFYFAKDPKVGQYTSDIVLFSKCIRHLSGDITFLWRAGLIMPRGLWLYVCKKK
jgi:hypothetical protein